MRLKTLFQQLFDLKLLVPSVARIPTLVIWQMDYSPSFARSTHRLSD